MTSAAYQRERVFVESSEEWPCVWWATCADCGWDGPAREDYFGARRDTRWRHPVCWKLIRWRIGDFVGGRVGEWINGGVY